MDRQVRECEAFEWLSLDICIRIIMGISRNQKWKEHMHYIGGGWQLVWDGGNYS